jgi:hypothetical protein
MTAISNKDRKHTVLFALFARGKALYLSQNILVRRQISEDEMSEDRDISSAFSYFSDKRDNFCRAKKELDDATRALRDLLDEPLRSSGLVPAGKDWTLKLSESEKSIIVFVWSEARQKGRKKAEPPFRSLTR